ncbi:MAG: Rrf2 family transcriptional regulator [Ginsengibacter sp.]|jgi:Rrf2 family protein
MKISAQEEYGLRILLRIAKCRDDDNSMSIPALSTLEGLSNAYVAKITRILRQSGYINSTPGNIGGYILALPAEEININKVLKALGGSMFDVEFCNSYSGATKFCTNSVDCSVRSLWQMIQFTIDGLLDKVSLADLTGNEGDSSKLLHEIFSMSLPEEGSIK